MPSLWYLLAAVAYGAFLVFCCLVASVCSTDDYPQPPDWLDAEYAKLCSARNLDSEED